MCVVITLCFAVWLVYTQPPQQARMAWYCLSAALQQYESSPAQVRATLVARIGMPPDQAAHFFQQLRKLLAAMQQTPLEQVDEDNAWKWPWPEFK